MLEERHTCRVWGALLQSEPDLRVQYRERHRDPTGQVHLQHASVLGRFKCPRCGGWSEYALWEVAPQRDRGESAERSREDLE
ncbi:MAG TPA: hypothetical protein VKT82_01680 [Ktedonobacterales bacterium]|nr:hypothetical protein [Ktedonobacterales bacterium]